MTGEMLHPEFSRILLVEELGEEPVTRSLRGEEPELLALASRFGIDTLKSIGAELIVSAVGSRGLQVNGIATAHVVQNCEVTLEPVSDRIEEKFGVTYLPEGAEALELTDSSPLDEEEVELFDGESVDLGEMVAQQVLAAIDPYPRKDGVEFGKADGLSDNDDRERVNPFAVLMGFKPENGDAGDK